MNILIINIILIFCFNSMVFSSEDVSEKLIEYGKHIEYRGPYVHFVKEILENGRYVLLNDDSIWQIQSLYRAEKTREWEKGDIVFLDIMPKSQDNPVIYSLLNIRFPLDFHTAKLVGKIENMDFREIIEIDSKGYTIALDDGSMWIVGYSNSWESWNWKKGDKVLIFPLYQSQPNQYYLINLSQGGRSHYISASLQSS